MTKIPPVWPFGWYILHEEDDPALEAVRVVRNTCAEFMTENQASISKDAQRAWWDQQRLDPQVSLFVFYGNAQFHIPPGVVGYGLIRPTLGEGKTGPSVWLSGGLLPECRGMGLGAMLFGHLVHEAVMRDTTPELKVWMENQRAFRTYVKLGFTVVGVPGEKVHMVWKQRL